MKHPTFIGLALFILLLPLSGFASNSSESSSPPDDTTATTTGSVDEIARSLGVPSIVLGGSYDQGTFKMYNHNSKAQLTDNGRSTPIIDFVSAEHILDTIPMRSGNAVWGMNFTGSFGEQHTSYQNVPGGSGIIGKDLGSSVSGDYLAAAPFLYLRLGPIYPGTDSYWQFGYGLGAALWHFSGNPIFYTTQPDGSTLATSMPIGSTNKFFVYQTWRWLFHFGNIDIRFEGRSLSNRKLYGYNTSFENYGIGIAYTIHF
ncbi:MAG: hypothetical protein ACRESC_03935 [Gammaproteobacteria bacterium]